jgi:hypothetical protein
MLREMSVREMVFRASLFAVVKNAGPLSLTALMALVPGADHSDRDFALAFSDMALTKQLVIQSSVVGDFLVSLGEARSLDEGR